jgi:hypothetical protein
VSLYLSHHDGARDGLIPLQAGQQSCLVVKTTQQKFVGF